MDKLCKLLTFIIYIYIYLYINYDINIPDVIEGNIVLISVKMYIILLLFILKLQY